MRDPAKVLPGLACSLLPETEIGAVLGTPVRLLPSTGGVCMYAATQSDVERSVVVTAHREDAPKPHLAYDVAVIEPQSASAKAVRERTRLLALMRRPGAVAQR